MSSPTSCYLWAMRKILYFLALFGYLNVLCYEVKYCNLLNLTPVSSSDTLLEVVLEDIFEMSHHTDKEDLPEIMFDDYRILVLLLGIIPAVLIVSWLLRKLLLSNEIIRHAIYFVRRSILPGYYTFLYRFRPF